jgi:hypothetical protein
MDLELKDLIDNLGPNKVHQQIGTNEYEQNVQCHYSVKDDGRESAFYEDLFKMQKKRMTSIIQRDSSYSSIESLDKSSRKSRVYYKNDPVMYLMSFIKDPLVEKKTKDKIANTLSDFKLELLKDTTLLQTRKLKQQQKQYILQYLHGTKDVIKVFDEVWMTYFSLYLKVNFIVKTSGKIVKFMILNDDDIFDTVIITDPKEKHQYFFEDAVVEGGVKKTFKEAKNWLIENNIDTSLMMNYLSASEVVSCATVLGIELYHEIHDKNNNVKRKKKTKDELKNEILQRKIDVSTLSI